MESTSSVSESPAYARSARALTLDLLRDVAFITVFGWAIALRLVTAFELVSSVEDASLERVLFNDLVLERTGGECLGLSRDNNVTEPGTAYSGWRWPFFASIR